LIFHFIAWIHPRLQTPIIATILGGIASGIQKKEKNGNVVLYFIPNEENILNDFSETKNA
jgi:hypothetical protein